MSSIAHSEKKGIKMLREHHLWCHFQHLRMILLQFLHTNQAVYSEQYGLIKPLILLVCRSLPDIDNVVGDLAAPLLVTAEVEAEDVPVQEEVGVPDARPSRSRRPQAAYMAYGATHTIFSESVSDQSSISCCTSEYSGSRSQYTVSPPPTTS